MSAAIDLSFSMALLTLWTMGVALCFQVGRHAARSVRARRRRRGDRDVRALHREAEKAFTRRG